MLSLPAEPCARGQRFFHDRRSVDKNFDVCAGVFRNGARNALQPFLDKVVIVAVLRIDRYDAACFFLERVERILIGTVIQSEHNDAFRVGPKRLRMGALLGAAFHPAHGAMTSEREEAHQPFPDRLRKARRRQANGVETGFLRQIDNARFQRVGHEV